MKLKRSAYLLYIDSTFGGSTPEWFLIGKDTDELSTELNPDVSQVKNILDETSVQDNGYEPTIDVSAFYANPEDSIYPKVEDITMNRKTGDECRTKVLEVIIKDTSDTDHSAWVQDAIVKPTSYGGDTSGFQIPFTVYFDGTRTEGTSTLVDRVPTFTEV